MKRIKFILILILLSIHIVSCSKNQIETNFEPPVEGIHWGMLPDQVKEILSIPENQMSVGDERIRIIKYDNESVFKQKADIIMYFDEQLGIGLYSIEIYFQDMNKDDLIDELINSYGEATAVDKEWNPWQWESDKVSDLPKEMQDKIQYIHVELPVEMGVYSFFSHDTIWNEILKQPLVKISINDDALIYTAEYMAEYLMYSNDEAYNDIVNKLSN